MSFEDQYPGDTEESYHQGLDAALARKEDHEILLRASQGYNPVAMGETSNPVGRAIVTMKFLAEKAASTQALLDTEIEVRELYGRQLNTVIPELTAQIDKLREIEKEQNASAASEQESMYRLREQHDSHLKRAIRMEGRATRAEDALAEAQAKADEYKGCWTRLHEEIRLGLGERFDDGRTVSSQLNGLCNEIATLTDQLAMHQRDACYICGSKRILSQASGCDQCGAPVCCQTCCEATTLQSKLDALKKSKDEVVQNWINLHDEQVERADRAEADVSALKGLVHKAYHEGMQNGVFNEADRSSKSPRVWIDSKSRASLLQVCQTQEAGQQ